MKDEEKEPRPFTTPFNLTTLNGPRTEARASALAYFITGNAFTIPPVISIAPRNVNKVLLYFSDGSIMFKNDLFFQTFINVEEFSRKFDWHKIDHSLNILLIDLCTYLTQSPSGG